MSTSIIDFNFPEIFSRRVQREEHDDRCPHTLTVCSLVRRRTGMLRSHEHRSRASTHAQVTCMHEDQRAALTAERLSLRHTDTIYWDSVME